MIRRMLVLAVTPDQTIVGETREMLVDDPTPLEQIVQDVQQLSQQPEARVLIIEISDAKVWVHAAEDAMSGLIRQCRFLRAAADPELVQQAKLDYLEGNCITTEEYLAELDEKIKDYHRRQKDSGAST